MDAGDLELRRATYELLVRFGRCPRAIEVAAARGTGVDDVRAGWRRLHDAHALVLDEARAEIRMAAPFSAVPTAFRVHAGGRWWDANCAWDAFGVCAALGVDGEIDTACPDCGSAIALSVRGGRSSDESLLFHCLVPAARWWEDIAFT